MRRHWLIIAATMVLLANAIAEINHYLAPAGVTLFAGGLLVTFGALRLGLRNGLAATLFTGLAIDALEPVPFGTHMLLFAAVHVVLYHLRSRFPREEVVFGVVAALMANLALFLALSLLALGGHPAPGAAWVRLFADLFCSQVFIAAAAPWFFALQRRALELGGIDLGEEDRHVF